MKKITVAFDGLKFSASARDYAVHLAKLTHAHLVGLFMDDWTYTSYNIYELVTKKGKTEDQLQEYKEKDLETRKIAANSFSADCQKAGIPFSIHHDRNLAIQDVKHESIYTDLLLIDGKETLTHYTEKLPTRFIRELLMDAQSPVLVVPQKYKPIEKIVLLYDGEPSSVHAIKMFSYLLPQLKHLETEVISVNGYESSLHLPDNKLMKEFMKRHFPKAKFTVLKGWAEDEITEHLKNQLASSIVVLGAYRRSSVSRWFRKSMADVLMKELKLPLFIAHNK
jgi:nucleotide-binding universal stress UspA family protein